MSESTELLFVHALSPLHAGTGQSLGAVELAIARDRATGFPYLPGSSLKGSLRDRCEQEARDRTQALFGPDTQRAHEHAGALIVGDANLLLLPVRSLAGTFAWVTSPYLLGRLRRDGAEVRLPPLPEGPAVEHQECLVASDSSLLVDRSSGAQRVLFEDLDFRPREGADELAQWLAPFLFPGDAFWQRALRQRLCVVHDDIMGFLAQHGTDVVARVALKNDSKTVDNLWHEESLPTETVLVSLVCALPNEGTKVNGQRLGPEELLKTLGQLVTRPLQLGGKATVGHGRCRLVRSSERKEAPEAEPKAAVPPPPTPASKAQGQPQGQKGGRR